MTTPIIQIHLHADGSYSLRTQGVDAHRVRSLIQLAGRSPEKLRSYIGVAMNIVPEVITHQRRTDPPSGGFVAGE